MKMSRIGPKAWLVALAALGIGVASAATLARKQHTLQQTGTAPPRLCLGKGAAREAKTGVAWHRSTLALALASVPHPERTLLALGDELDRGEENAHPLSLGLDDPKADRNDRLQAELWPRVTAAQAWLRPEVELEGDDLAIVACSAGGARFALWPTEAGERQLLPLAPTQLRHRAWAIASAAWLTSDHPRELAARLRGQSAEPGSTIALVIERHLSVEGVTALADRARQLAERARRFARKVPDTLALLTSAAGEPIDSASRLEGNQLAVVPRLGSLARLDKFEGEIARQLQPHEEFVQRPRSLTRSAAESAGSDRK
jgi:hypothetical protein